MVILWSKGYLYNGSTSRTMGNMDNVGLASDLSTNIPIRASGMLDDETMGTMHRPNLWYFIYVGNSQ